MLFHIILLMICWLNSSSLFQTILTYFAPLNNSQTVLSYILITTKTVLSLINASLTWNFNFQGNCGCSTEWECRFSRLQSSFFKDRESQGQISILVMPVTVFCLAQIFFFFSFWEVRKGQVRKYFALERLVRKIRGYGTFFSPHYSISCYIVSKIGEMPAGMLRWSSPNWTESPTLQLNGLPEHEHCLPPAFHTPPRALSSFPVTFS